MKIYTRKGDDGTTGLWYGGRRPKSDARIDAYGTVDEAGSALGVARSLCGPDDARVAPTSSRCSSDLFVAGAELAAAPEAADRLEDGISRVTDGDDRRSSSPRSTATWTASSCRRSSSSPAAPALGPARPRARHPAPRRAPRRRARRGRRARLRHASSPTSTAPPTSSTRWPVSPTSTTLSSSRDAEVIVIRAVARPARWDAPRVEVDGHVVPVDEPEDRRPDPPLPHPPARRGPRLLHRADRRDVRDPQGVGSRPAWRSSSTSRARRRPATTRLRRRPAAARRPRRGAGRADQVDRGQVPGASHADLERRDRDQDLDRRRPDGPRPRGSCLRGHGRGPWNRPRHRPHALRGRRAGPAVARNESELRSAREECGRVGAAAHGRAASLALDVTDPDAGERILAEAEERFGTLDVVVNNAGTAKWRDLDESPRRTGTRPGS